MTKYVYTFGAGKADGRADMKNLLGGKGANLAEMNSIGLPVPAGFTITTEMCTVYYENNRKYPEDLKKQVAAGLKHIETVMGAKFGDKKNPLLVSVRSGARVSMPGMMDTVLNLGLNDETVQGIIKQTGNERFGWDSYRRFVHMYGDVVMGMKPESKDEEDPFETVMAKLKKEKKITKDSEMTAEVLQELTERYKKLIKERTKKDFPTDPAEQLWGAINAVFGSWMGERAIIYRKKENVPADWGTAVNVQAMVYGNMGDDCATGVAFTRNPATGENAFYGEYLINAQGEDVVAGIRTPQQVTVKGSKEWAKDNNISEKERKSLHPSLEESMPAVYKQLVDVYQKLEHHYKDMQDIEFTIQKDKLWMLQTRNGKRTAAAAVKIAVDMVKEKLITETQALLRVKPSDLDQLLHPIFDPKATKKVLAKGLPASPGASSGRVVFNAEDAETWKNKGEKVILVRIETSPEDIGGMDAAVGILTARGGMTSHAAVVARGWGKCCVAGAGEIQIDYKKRQMKVKDAVVKEGDWLSLDGSTGEVMLGEVKTIEAGLSGDFGTIMKWADKTRQIDVRTNADTPKDASVARKFGAQGIGLCRTEHMFFEGERIRYMREMILADDEAGRRKALKKLLKFQTDDFYGILKAMEGYPVTIRTLDPPLHEFVPHEEKQQKEMAKELGISAEQVKHKVDSLHEFNPMLGHRGCRLGITYPEITEMQAEAIFEAACKLTKEGVTVYPEVMIPLIGTIEELKHQKAIVKQVAEAATKKYGVAGKLKYLIGTMIEIPRAAIIADQVATEAEFFSFGTNDLTQMTFGYSRDDAGKFLQDYYDKKILKNDPFQSIDQEGVGLLMKWGVDRGRTTRPDLKIGICGEHGGEPESVMFCHKLGFDYVSCSPFRVPIARLAAAHGALKYAEDRDQSLKTQNHKPVKAKASEA
ncbi:MAG TPA: pyruvate, phosphate dikinase [Candidatus Rifleibacterium sp.]|nr:pyruvate, phosphate dikinase [Candidatus Rifleibacterium sp.]HPT47473.1 pyruvate, phosphate dikinase [Candidatus Rifleibacterium sp.]